MGHRATIEFVDDSGRLALVYTHWFGTPGSVLPVLAEFQAAAAAADQPPTAARFVAFCVDRHGDAFELVADHPGDIEHRYTVRVAHGRTDTGGVRRDLSVTVAERVLRSGTWRDLGTVSGPGIHAAAARELERRARRVERLAADGHPSALLPDPVAVRADARRFSLLAG
jgi:hypothetical protein